MPDVINEINIPHDQSPRERAKERAVDLAIKSTLAYSAIFKYPLSFYQLSTFLIKAKKPFEYDFYKKNLRKLCKKGKVAAKNEKFYLPHIKPLSWEVRKKNSQELLANNTLTFKALHSVPWIKLLCITGSVAAYNADKQDDIDIFVVTQKNRIWLTRLYIVFILKALGKYRTTQNFSGKICPNLYVDESNMQWDLRHHNGYVAHEILMMHPVISRNNTYFKFIEMNKWIFDFFNNIEMNTHIKTLPVVEKKPSQVVDFLENLAMKYQIKYMQSKQTTEITKKGIIHFNNNDWSTKILDEYNKAVVDLEKA